MTIASEISRLQGAKADIRQAIIDKWVSVSSSLTIDDYACCISCIPTWSNNYFVKFLMVWWWGWWAWGAYWWFRPWWWWGGWAIISWIRNLTQKSHSITIWSWWGWWNWWNYYWCDWWNWWNTTFNSLTACWWKWWKWCQYIWWYSWSWCSWWTYCCTSSVYTAWWWWWACANANIMNWWEWMIINWVGYWWWWGWWSGSQSGWIWSSWWGNWWYKKSSASSDYPYLRGCSATWCWGWGWGWGWCSASSSCVACLRWWNWWYWVVEICYISDWSWGINCATWWTKSSVTENWITYCKHRFTSNWTFCIVC